ncbi:uncharacterized protein LTR77_001069 [Saxophila tyrrhenica]|uniref:NAD(P)-binding domain-containing protein n=1 Tax=Saxophila tyrrhenica TaxID=1690608 RepID=A0AAV9PK20_9PEZI|nr:hypothetical protein LTR77_001069 [Saxophila tyrrhenica]
MPSVIVFGATGFLGAPLTRAIVKAHPDWKVTAYVRGTRTSDEVKKELGVKRIETGDFTEFEKIKALCKENDIAVNAGNSFTDAPISAIVAGLSERSEGPKGKLLHISGAGNFLDFGTTGEFNPASKVWDDDNEEDIKLVNDKMFNGQSDVVALQAGKNGAVDTYVVCTPVTYGGAAVGSKGMGVGYSLITGNAKPLGYVPYIGNGSAVLSTAHVLDVVPFMLKVLELAASGPAQGSVYSRWFNVETQRVAWKDMATELAKVMYAKGIFKSPEAKSVPLEEAGEGEVKYLVAGNMLMHTNRSARMGFKPTQPSILTQVHEDLKDAAL